MIYFISYKREFVNIEILTVLTNYIPDTTTGQQHKQLRQQRLPDRIELVFPPFPFSLRDGVPVEVQVPGEASNGRLLCASE